MFGGQATWYYQGLAGITQTPGTVAYSDLTINPVYIFGKCVIVTICCWLIFMQMTISHTRRQA